MDTLVIVRKIREAESLADSGKHGDACRILEPLLKDPGLTDSHKQLVAKKLELFNKQQQRMTRVMSRRGTSVLTRDEADASSERTAIRKAIDVDRSERPTDHTIEKDVPQGAATEVVPKARNVETEVPQQQRSHKIPSLNKPPAIERPPTVNVRDDQIKSDYSGNWPKVHDSKVRMRASDSQELAPLADGVDDGIAAEAGEDDPRKTDIFRATAPASSTEVPRRSSTEIPVGNPTEMVPRLPDPEEESAPTITRYGSVGSSRDTPVPQSNTPAVRDSFIVPRPKVDVPVPGPASAGRASDDDSTYLLADEHFAPRSISSRSPRSNPELKALADRLPDDDLRRELALELVKLREEVDRMKSGSHEAPVPGTRKVRNTEQPQSGSFHIPASQVNTIVRRAAGTDSIEVHMPTRDEDASELQVLRRDSVRGKTATQTPTDRIALAQDYIDATSVRKPGVLRPVATVLGVAVIFAVIAWAVHLGYKTIAGAQSVEFAMTEDGAGGYLLGESYEAYDDLKSKQNITGRQLHAADGWLIQHDGDNRITAVTIAGPGSAVAGATERFKGFKLEFGAAQHSGDDWSVDALLKALGEPTPPFSEELFRTEREYTLHWQARQGTRALEIHFLASAPRQPAWVRVLDVKSAPPPPKLPTE
ncbi:MAG: hypothetical protein IPK87_14435 [Planctomycetes bacterium]|nr:hypothetical protein [Planctomycetota bacterium]